MAEAAQEGRRGCRGRAHGVERGKKVQRHGKGQVKWQRGKEMPLKRIKKEWEKERTNETAKR